MTFRSLRHLVGFVAVGAGITAVVAVLPRTESSLAVPPFVRAVTEVPNPEIADSCGTNVVLVLDASGSIESSGAVDEVRDAGEAFLDALADTGSTARVTQFASLSEELAPQAEVTAASLQPGGAFRTAINGYYNPKPPRPSNVNIFSYNGSGNPQSSNNWRAANSSNQFTNWDQSLDQAGEIQPEPVELVVYVTDGDPTAYDFNQAGDPFDAGPPPDVGVNTNRGSANSLTLDRAVDESNLLQAANTRILAVGVGSALDNPNSQSRLEQISGPKVIRDADLDATNSINDVDVALVREFDKLAQFLRGVVSQLCSPSLSIRKLAQTPGSAEYLPAEDWDITVAPSVDSPGTFEWILPDTDPVQTMRCGSPDDPNDGASRTCATDNVGLANFQWEPNPTDAATSATVVETLKPNYTAGRPDDADYRCQVKDINGNVTVVEGELNQGNGFSLDVDSQDIITCSIYNSFDYAPDITLTKVDDPLQVRGDLAPPANTVTSTFVATNTGNAVLDQVTLTDDRCNPVGPSDDDGDGLLGIGESWTFTCTRNLTSSPGASPNLVVNNAEVTGVDPAGTLVSATADATVTAYAPAIALSKSADADQVQVGIDTDVEYTYVATNTGNMTLTDVTVVDSAGPSTCAPVTPASVATLAPGATTTFTCTTILNPGSPQDTFVNTATVTGDPILPDLTAAPPEVTATATEVVTAFDLGLVLTKTASRSIVFPNTDVTYTYTVENTGTVGLVRPAADPAPGPPADPRDGLVNDSLFGPTGFCTSVLYTGGDTGDDQVLSQDETWNFECTTNITGVLPVVKNTAFVVLETIGPNATTLRDFAKATVEVVRPVITIEKSAVRPVVLDPAALAIAGPDVPIRTPAAYVYTVRNSGNVPVRNVSISDVIIARSPDGCSPVSYVSGDAQTVGVLDVGEAWEFECVVVSVGPGAQPLTKADSDTAVGATTPGTVTNTAKATAEAFLTDPLVQAEETLAIESNTASASVQVILPAITLEKTPCLDDGTAQLACDPDPNDADDLLVRAGTDVTYKYEVSNVGDSNVKPVGLFDDRCDGISFTSGDTNSNGLIDGGSTPEIWEYRCTVPVDFPSPVLNTAGVAVVGPLGDFYTATADASVKIFEPAINLTKTVSATLVPIGSQVTYTFEVTNGGAIDGDGVPADLVLADIELADVSAPANPACVSPTFISGDGNNNDLLDVNPAETWTYQCTGTINVTTVDLAVVRGTDIQGGFVYDFDTATVSPYTAGIAVVKTAQPTVLPIGGGPVTYTYAVTNTGNVPLDNVESRVTDNKCAPVTYVSGDDDLNGLLTSATDLFETGAAEVWNFQCVTTITEDTTNVVTTVGTPVRPGEEGNQLLGPDVNATATAFVQVPLPTTTVPTTTAPPTTAPPTTAPPTTAPPTTEPPPSVLPPPPPTMPGGELPTTGNSPTSTVLLSLALLAGGATLIAITRRRRVPQR